MNAGDIREIRDTWKPGRICCDRYAACHILPGGDYGIQESKPFLSLGETEQKRHLQYIRKMLTGDIGGRIVSVGFEGKAPEILTANREKRLCNGETFEGLCGFIRNNCDDGSRGFVIMAYHALYDIPSVGTDGAVQEDNDEVYEYLLCMICPTKYTNPVLAVTSMRVYTHGGNVTRRNPQRHHLSTMIYPDAFVWKEAADGKE